MTCLAMLTARPPLLHKPRQSRLCWLTLSGALSQQTLFL
jgi:hypothetical protein